MTGPNAVMATRANDNHPKNNRLSRAAYLVVEYRVFINATALRETVIRSAEVDRQERTLPPARRENKLERRARALSALGESCSLLAIRWRHHAEIELVAERGGREAWPLKPHPGRPQAVASPEATPPPQPPAKKVRRVSADDTTAVPGRALPRNGPLKVLPFMALLKLRLGPRPAAPQKREKKKEKGESRRSVVLEPFIRAQTCVLPASRVVFEETWRAPTQIEPRRASECSPSCAMEIS